MKRLVCSSFLLALVLSTSASPLAAAEAEWIAKEARVSAPKLVLSDVPGRRRQLTEFKGKVLTVNFWATWCLPCQGEMPEFTKVYAEYKDRNVEFLGAANEPRSARPKVQAFMKEYAMQFPVWMELSEVNMKEFGIGEALPGTVILDSQGRIAARIVGTTDAVQLRQLLDRVLSEEPPVARVGGR
jgi:thiol-disulfide isomerase/thioredoxin